MKIRYEKKYSIAYVLSQVTTSCVKDAVTNFRGSRIEVDGDKINMSSQRYKTFLKSATCLHCGIKGKYFYKEKHNLQDPYHFNLYGLDSQGNEVLFTKDHIQPKSKGGKNSLKNYQTLCEVCNTKKGDNTEIIGNPNRRKSIKQKRMGS